jgi:hypothetical protein
MRDLESRIKVINMGILEFVEGLVGQGIEVVHVDWRPPTEEDEEISGLLDSLL